MRRLLVCATLVLTLAGCVSARQRITEHPPASLATLRVGSDPTRALPFAVEGRVGARTSIWLLVQEPGTVTVDISWARDATLAIMIYREGTPGYYARTEGEDGSARLTWEATPEILRESRPEEWRLAIVNLSKQATTGEIRVEYAQGRK